MRKKIIINLYFCVLISFPFHDYNCFLERSMKTCRLLLRTSEIHLFYNLQVFYWHFLEILWLFIFLVLYSYFYFFFSNFYSFNPLCLTVIPKLYPVKIHLVTLGLYLPCLSSSPFLGLI